MEIRDYKSTILVKLNESIQWKYPIRGIAELNV